MNFLGLELNIINIIIIGCIFLFIILFIKVMFNRLEKNRIIDIFINNLKQNMSSDYFELPKDIYVKSDAGLVFVGRGVAGILLNFEKKRENYAFVFIRKYYFNFFRMFDVIMNGNYYKDELIFINWDKVKGLFNKRVLFIPYNLEFYNAGNFIIRYNEKDFNLVKSIIFNEYNYKIEL